MDEDAPAGTGVGTVLVCKVAILLYTEYCLVYMVHYHNKQIVEFAITLHMHAHAHTHTHTHTYMHTHTHTLIRTHSHTQTHTILQATDADSGSFGIVDYSLQTATTNFTINRDSGILTLSRPYNKTSGSRIVRLTVAATDRAGGFSENVAVRVSTVQANIVI